MYKLELQKDIYSFTYFKFATDHNPVLLGELSVKCFITIFVQLALIAFKLEEMGRKNERIYRGDAILNFVRIICAIIMHLSLYPEIKVSLSMFQYAVNNDKVFC
jgi:hypothetical protein